MARKILIIGGVAGGATAATRLRRLNEDDQIIMFEKGEHISFANCGMPYFIGDKIKNRSELMVQTVQGMSDRYNLDIRNLSEVTKIDPENKEVSVLNLKENETYQESFDELIISTGAKPIVPKIPGLAEANNIFTLRNIEDMDQIKQAASNPDQTATVISGGFIGIEVMENLKRLGLKVQLVEMSDQVMPNLDFEMAQLLHQEIRNQGVKLFLNNGLQEIQDNGKKLVLQDGQNLSTDFTILAIGVTPASELAESAGIKLGVKKTIEVDHQFRTNFSHIYAIGDVIQVENLVDHTMTNIPLAGPANRQGRLVADVINGIDVDYKGVQGTSVAQVFNLTAASTGDNEKALQKHGIKYHVIHTHPESNASYYPDSKPLDLKIIFDNNAKILGAQAVGQKGADKRIDVIATAMKFGARVNQLSELELSYAPPYGSAKDPVNFLGYVADDMINNRVKTIQWNQVDKLVEQKAYIIDVREDSEYGEGNVKTSKLMTLNHIREHLDELPKDQPIYVYCRAGLRGYIASRILRNNGFDVVNIDGGYLTIENGKR
ncbi:FAD-dependent oxidoreductase [Companilactobacillus zhongbaensis]|uniref:FAD-dependent oxidoreductase n=1 Tax=Companilactobacillus zhongbaensis TaxID=2486009 RepID=UPI000F79E70A|nr:FAD-dependent oxidoreductase [Companilactobacillus zhongbaensis]